MVDFQHRADRALVCFSGELTHEAAVDLVDMLVRVYYHPLIELLINSSGGAPSETARNTGSVAFRRRHA